MQRNLLIKSVKENSCTWIGSFFKVPSIYFLQSNVCRYDDNNKKR